MWNSNTFSYQVDPPGPSFSWLLETGKFSDFTVYVKTQNLPSVDDDTGMLYTNLKNRQ